jgi:hypothetical protein
VDLGSYHRGNGSDTLVPVFISLWRWTPFYWECNRIGMLLPLLAMPFKNPMTNLVVQAGLALFGSFATFFLLARYVLRGGAWPLAGALGCALCVLLLDPMHFLGSTFFQLHYPVGMVLGLGGLLLLAGPPSRKALTWRLPAALALMLLAHWVNNITAGILGPIVAARWLLCRRKADAAPGNVLLRLLRSAWDTETALGIGLLAIGYLGGAFFRLQVRCPGDPATLGILPPDRWLEGWARLAGNTWSGAVEERWYANAAAAAAVVVVLLLPVLRRLAGPSARAAVAMIGGIGVYGLFVGTHQWVEKNEFAFKYWVPVIFCVHLALAILIIGPLYAWANLRLRRRMYLAAAPLALGAAALGYGIPSLKQVRADLDNIPHNGGFPLPQRTEEILASRATHLAGNYGNVWVNAFHANLVLYERGEDRVVWGVSGRCLPTWDKWAKVPPEDMRVAALVRNGKLDPEAQFFFDAFLPPLTKVEEGKTVWLYRPTETLPPAQWPASAGPILLSWHSGFNGPEGDAVHNNRWCGRRGKLTLHNRTEAPRIVTLDLQLRTGHLRPALVTLDGPLFVERTCANQFLGRLTRTFTLPPGSHLICFECDARPVPSPDTFRSFVFRVEDVKLTDHGEAPAGLAGISPACAQKSP